MIVHCTRYWAWIVFRLTIPSAICFAPSGWGEVQRLYEPMAEWLMQCLPQREGGYTLDLDSTVFECYGKQKGSLKGHNPRKHGRLFAELVADAVIETLRAARGL